MNVLVTQSGGENHPLNHISAQRTASKMGMNEDAMVKTSGSRASNETQSPILCLALRSA